MLEVVTVQETFEEMRQFHRLMSRNASDSQAKRLARLSKIIDDFRQAVLEQYQDNPYTCSRPTAGKLCAISEVFRIFVKEQFSWTPQEEKQWFVAPASCMPAAFANKFRLMPGEIMPFREGPGGFIYFAEKECS